MARQPMTPGGQWLVGGSGTPHYVLDPDHVKRLLHTEGFQIIDDPRLSDEDEVSDEDEEKTEDEEEEDEEPEEKPKKRAKK